MRIDKIFIMAFFFFFIFISPGFSSDEVAHNGGLSQWIWPVINFALIVAVLIVFLRKPLQLFFKQRTEAIERSLREAREAKEIAEKALKEVEERLKLKDEEIKRIIDASRETGESERERLVEEGKAMSRRIKEQAEDNIAFELKRAKDEIKAEAVEIAVELAEKKLKDRLSKEQQLKLFEDAIKRLDSVK